MSQDPEISFFQKDEYVKIIKELIELHPYAISVYTLSGEEIACNKRSLETFGENPPEGFNILRDVNFDIPDLENIMARVFSGEVVEVPSMWMNPAKIIPGVSQRDEDLCFRPFAYPVYDPEGNLALIVIFFDEITEQKRAELSLRKQEEMYRILVESSHDIIVILQNHRLVFANSRFFEFTGYTGEEIKDLSPITMVRPALQKEIMRFIRQRSNGEKVPENYEFEIADKTGEYHWVEARLSEISWEDQPAIMLFARDISDRKIGEIQILESQKRLQKANADLKMLNQEMESFVYSISHDLKSPLLSIEGMVSLIMNNAEEKLDPQTLGQMERVKANANRMSLMVDNLLDLSRVGRMDSDASPIDILTVARQSAACTQYCIDGRKLQFSFSGDSLKVYYPLSRLSQVFSNLIDNAAKFMGEDTEPQIHINVSRDGDYAVAMVQDNGIGIEKRFHKEIFLPFRRLASSKSKPGLGMGLGILRKIVECNGGRIWVESEPGEGSKFFFTIPLPKTPDNIKHLERELENEIGEEEE